MVHYAISVGPTSFGWPACFSPCTENNSSARAARVTPDLSQSQPVSDSLSREMDVGKDGAVEGAGMGRVVFMGNVRGECGRWVGVVLKERRGESGGVKNGIR